MDTEFKNTVPMPQALRDTQGFADQAYLGKNSVWRYVVAVALVAGATYGILRLVRQPLYGILVRGGDASGLGHDIAPTLGLLTFTYAVLLGLMLSVFPFMHRRSWRSFLTARARIDQSLFARSFLVLLALCAGGLAIDLYFGASDLTFTAMPGRVLAIMPVALLFLPLQCLAEELFFRGYIAQAVGRLTPLWLLRLLVPAFLFGAAHFDNPEMGYDQIWVGADYLLAGLYLGLIALKGKGLEASFGLHFANNIFTVLVAGTSVKVLPVPALWTAGAPHSRLGFFTDIALYSLHYVLVFGLGRRTVR